MFTEKGHKSPRGSVLDTKHRYEGT